MDNIALRTRYPRHSVATRRKKKSDVREIGSYRDKLAKQVVISVLILMVAGIIKNANTAVTSYICDKIQAALSQNIELQSVYAGIEEVINRVMKKENLSNKTEREPSESAGAIKDQAYNKGEQESKISTGENLGAATPKEAAGKNSSVTQTPTPAPKSSATPSSQAGQTATSSQAVSPAATTIKSIFITPVSGPLGEFFGDRVHPFTNTLKPHKGVDIEANQGSAIKAAASGEVLEAGYEKTLGNYIKLQHDGSMSTIYAHCSQLLVKSGQKVKQGDTIAKVGSTGLSTGAHLHFEIWKDGKAVDPLDYIKVPEK